MSRKEPCPECRKKGKDTSGDNLVIFDDGGGKCFACGYTKQKEGKAVKSKLSIEQVDTYPVGGDPARKVAPSVLKMYDVRYSVSTATGKPQRVYYPYYKGNKMLGAKLRHLEEKDFAVAGELACLFGQSLYPKGATDVLFITEGEEDALALKSFCEEEGKNYAVVSLPNGASVDRVVTEQVEFFQQFKQIFLVMDSDEPGQKAAERLGDFLVSITDVFNVELDGFKDFSELWVTDSSQCKAQLAKAERYEPDGVVCGSDLVLDDILRPMEEGYKIPYPGLQEKLHGLRKAEIVTLCAGSGIGKSTLCRELAYSLVNQGCRVAMIGLEDQMEVGPQSLIAIDMNIPLGAFRMSPPDKVDVQKSWDKLINTGNVYFWKHFGKMNIQRLLDRLRYYAKSKSCDFIILDHLHSVIAASRESNERQAIDSLMDELSQLVVETGVGLISVVHLKRPTGDKSFARGGEVELSDLRGSAAIEQYSWAVVGLERDQQGEDADFSRVRVLKNRTFGFTGVADTLKYEPETGRLSTFQLDEGVEEDEELLGTGHRDDDGSQEDPSSRTEGSGSFGRDRASHF